jgi:hypothetical protein
MLFFPDQNPLPSQAVLFIIYVLTVYPLVPITIQAEYIKENA